MPVPARPGAPRRAALACALGVVVLAAHATPPAGPRQYDFEARLDGRPIGEHRFTVTPQGDGRRVTSDAHFEVRLLGIAFYRYDHHDEERWKDDCLEGMDARTQDNGKASEVHAQAAGDGLSIATAQRTEQSHGCIMSFAYWDAGLRRQGTLLNAQTGRLESVAVTRLPDAPIETPRGSVTATGWRIRAEDRAIDVWYGPEDDWIGLDSTVSGGRRLSYRLR